MTIPSILNPNPKYGKTSNDSAIASGKIETAKKVTFSFTNLEQVFRTYPRQKEEPLPPKTLICKATKMQEMPPLLQKMVIPPSPPKTERPRSGSIDRLTKVYRPNSARTQNNYPNSLAHPNNPLIPKPPQKPKQENLPIKEGSLPIRELLKLYLEKYNIHQKPDLGTK